MVINLLHLLHEIVIDNEAINHPKWKAKDVYCDQKTDCDFWLVSRDMDIIWMKVESSPCLTIFNFLCSSIIGWTRCKHESYRSNVEAEDHYTQDGKDISHIVLTLFKSI